jgi:hypothetical protein
LEVFDIRTNALLFQTHLNTEFDFGGSGYFVEIASTPDPMNVLYLIAVHTPDYGGPGLPVPKRVVFAKMDLVTGEWRILPSPPVADIIMSGEVTMTCSDEHVYIAAVCGAHHSPSLFVYDMTVQQWQPLLATLQPKRLLLPDSYMTRSVLLAHEGLLFAWTSWFSSLANSYLFALNVYDPMLLSWHEIEVPSSIMNQIVFEGMGTLGNKDILMHWCIRNDAGRHHHHHATLCMPPSLLLPGDAAKPKFVITKLH